MAGTVDLRRYAKWLNMLCFDRMDVYGMVEATDEDGAINHVPSDVPTQSDVACHLSLEAPASPNVKPEGLNAVVELKPTVICALDIPVAAGDKIVIRRCHSDGAVYARYAGTVIRAGMPNKFNTHQEFALDMEGDAGAGSF